MAIVKKKLGIDVLSAAKIRIKKIFDNGLKVYLNASGGKDSIVLMSLVYDEIIVGNVNPKQLEVVFIDEEVIYEEVIKVCMEWRKKFMLAGAKFTWYTIEHRNNNCFNSLENNENFIPWDRYESANWSHKKPSFAVSDSPYLVPRVENYQEFLKRSESDGITIIGVRAAESVQRLQYLANIFKRMDGLSQQGIMYPIYDWTDKDVWKYIKDKNLNFPDVYLRMYESGVPKRNLRICNLFSIDTCSSLVHMFEVYPDLWESIVRREPNAYLVRLYWDTEMFRRETKRKKEYDKTSGIENNTDYRKKLIDVVSNPTVYFKNHHALDTCRRYRKVLINYSSSITPEMYKKMYLNLMAGDTKHRNIRAILTNIVKNRKCVDGTQSNIRK